MQLKNKKKKEDIILQEYQTVTHQFEPVFDEHSKVLILGTFPSVKSREQNFITDIRRTDSGRCLRI